jgi:hypothetical protein
LYVFSNIDIYVLLVTNIFYPLKKSRSIVNYPTTMTSSLVDGGENKSTASKRRVSDIGGKEVLLNNTAKKRRRRGEVNEAVDGDVDVDDDDNDDKNDCDTIVTYPIYTNTESLLSTDAFPCRFYRQTFKGKTFGLQLVEIEGRIVVAENVTGSSKPALGDVLFKGNDYTLPFRFSLNTVCLYMRRMLSNAGGVELTFPEIPMFWSDVAEPILKKREANGRRNAQLKE